MSLEGLQTELFQLLRGVHGDYQHLAFSSSMSAEDMLITDVIQRLNLPVTVFTLDTGRLPAETYELIHQVQQHYDLDFKIYSPDASDLENFVNQYGCNAFFQSVDYRKLCCKIRKVGPLQRALAGKDCWITGLRREQSVTREALQKFEYDKQFNIQKCNPLVNWSSNDVWSYIKKYDVPYNTLHDRGYPSIGCAPCTRAIAAGEDERAGRWWWEDKQSRECGLHKVHNIPVSA